MTTISNDGRFEWDSEKNEINIQKHGMSFEQATVAFDDPFFLERYDKEHSSATESRFFDLGMIQTILIAAASYVENERIRLISAREASPKEKEIYYEHIKNIHG